MTQKMGFFTSGFWRCVIFINLDLDTALGDKFGNNNSICDLLEDCGISLASQSIIECMEIGSCDNIIKVNQLD